MSLTCGSLGFETADDTTLLPAYIQQHALNRFQERTMLPPGLVIGYLYDLFTNGLPIYHRTKDHSLVEFFVDEAFPKELLPLESTAFLHTYLGYVAALSPNTKLSLTKT